MHAMSGLLEHLEQHSYSLDGQPLSLHGDPAYPHRVHLQCPFAQRLDLTDDEQAFYQSTSRVPICVDWVIGDIVTFFNDTDYKRVED